MKGAIAMKKKDGFSHKLGSWLDRDNVAGYVFILPFIIGLIVLGVVNKLFRMDEASY